MTTTLTDSISRISIRAVGADIRFDIGAGTVTPPTVTLLLTVSVLTLLFLLVLRCCQA